MSRVYNFSAGPSALPEEVLRRAADEMLDYKGIGMSVMEMTHRSKPFEEIINGAEALLRELMGIPENYKVLFLQGGASSQFSMIPLNLMKKDKIDLVLTGMWAQKAFDEASRFGQVNVVASSKDKTYSYIPKLDASRFDPDADYFYICENNTIYGTKFKTLPETGNVPLVADLSSCILSEPIDVSKYGLIFAGAQKNMGPAGLTVVIIREDLITEPKSICPQMFRYKIHDDAKSLYNTPPTYAIYICRLVLEWVKSMGGLEKLGEINHKKAECIYSYLDSSSMFHATVEPDSRSIMNIPFVTGNEELDARFIKEATAAGFVNLKGHRSVGGMRASIYNATTLTACEELVAFMKEFERKG